MSDFKETWIEGFYRLAVDLARKYTQDPESVLSSIGFRSVNECLMETYNNLVGKNEIPKLEDLSEEHKKALWEQSKRYAKERFKRIVICKCLYLLDVLTK